MQPHVVQQTAHVIRRNAVKNSIFPLTCGVLVLLSGLSTATAAPRTGNKRTTQAATRSRVVSNLENAPGTIPVVVQVQITDPQEIEKRLADELNDKRITIKIFNAGSVLQPYYSARVSGLVKTPEEKSSIENEIAARLRETKVKRVFSSIIVDKDKAQTPEEAAKPKPKPAPEPKEMIVTDQWPLTFVSDKIKSIEDDSDVDDGSEIYDVANLVETMNKLYQEKENGPKIVQRARNMLLLKGSPKTILTIKRQLALLDAPGPQVQLDVWPLQLSGQGEHTEETAAKIAMEVGKAQGHLAILRNLPNTVFADWSNGRDKWDLAALVSTSNNGNRVERNEILKALDRLGFDIDPRRPLSTMETMLFYGLLDERERKTVLDELQKEAQSQLAAWDAAPSPDFVPFQRFKTAFDLKEDSVASDWKAINDFLDALNDYRIAASTLDQPVSDATPPDASEAKPQAQFQQSLDFYIRQSKMEKGENPSMTEQQMAGERTRAFKSPERLRRAASAVDALLQAAVDALNADLEEMCLAPLFKKIQTIQKTDISTGVSLQGRTRMVVTSGLHSSLKPSLVSYVETTTPPVLDAQFLKDSSGSSGLADILTSYSGSQILGLTALLNQPKPTYTKVAPGIAINVRPAVLPNAASARLQIDATFGVATDSPVKKADENFLQASAADAVQSHHLRTDAVIGTFDLFDISSFALNTTHPRPPGYIPVLGQLPIVGRAFQWRRKDTRLTHSSIILVNAVILPRSMDLANFFGAISPFPAQNIQ